MTRYFSTLFLLVGLYAYNQSENHQETVLIDKRFETEVAESRQLIANLMTEKNIPGLSIAVASKDKILWSEGFGYADLESKSEVHINSKFRIGSISKSLTALALGKLLEEKKIRLSDTIQKFVPDFPEKKYPITLEDLATHTAGIRNYNYQNGEYFSSEPYKSVNESLMVFKEDSLLFKPRTQYNYSTYGYVLLSAAIEGATQQNYLDYMEDSVFKPLGMQHTMADLNHQIIPDRVRFYQSNEGEIINAAYVDNSNKWAGGGFLSTSEDLVLMAQQLLSKSYLMESTLELLWTPAVLSNKEKTNYCLGWRKDEDTAGRTYVHHGGSSIGGRSFLLMYPKEEVIIAINCNVFARFNENFVSKIAEKFLP